MKTKILLSFFLLSVSTAGFCTTWTITTSNYTFSPSNLSIASGDIVNFSLESIHDAQEVSQSSWNANVGTSNGGFSVPLGGGTVSGLSVGTHWYVCTFHIQTNQMKGIITVTALGVNDFQLVKSFTVFPNPATDFINVKANDNSFDSTFCIIDEQGRMVSGGKLTDVTTTIDLSQFTSGVYFLQVGDDKKQTFRFLKK